jgi:DNA-binding transcriptional LysR family regulator
VGAPEYLERNAAPAKPEDLLRHECITFRSQTTGALYVWELERGKKTWRVPVRGGVVTNDGATSIALAEQGLGLAYALEPMVAESLRAGRLQIVLDPYSPSVPGFFLFFPAAHNDRKRCDCSWKRPRS